MAIVLLVFAAGACNMIGGDSPAPNYFCFSISA
jgi:hypothetical protein